MKQWINTSNRERLILILAVGVSAGSVLTAAGIPAVLILPTAALAIAYALGFRFARPGR